MPAKDTSLFEDSAGTLSNGQGEYLFAGKTNQPNGKGLRRAMLMFDLSQIPAGATITSASLRLNLSKTISGSLPMTLHRIQSDWGEAGSDASDQEGRGAAASPGDATWVHRQFPSTNWNTPGGDFVAASSGTTNVAGNGPYTWSTAEMVADIQSWLQDPATNFGWLLRGDESTNGTAKRFDSKESANAANRPALSIEYDVPAAASLSIADVSIAEGNEGTTTLDVPVTLSEPVAEPVTVNFKLVAGNATVDTDFQPAEGMVTFQPDGPLVQNVSIAIVGDTVTEADETLTVELSDAVGASIERATATATIQNDDDPPGIAVGDVSVTEADEGTTAATLTVTLDHGSDFPISVEYSTQDDSALAGTDYETATGTVNLAPGQLTATIEVSVVGDTNGEETESFSLRLSNPTNSQITDDVAAVEIIDNDDAATSPWQNPDLPEDVSGDGAIVPLDALLIINRLNVAGPGPLPEPNDELAPPPFFDVDGDNELAPIDALIVINYLNDHPAEVEARFRPRTIATRPVDKALVALAFRDWQDDENQKH
jgi:hypothetical protein